MPVAFRKSPHFGKGEPHALRGSQACVAMEDARFLKAAPASGAGRERIRFGRKLSSE
jgi:hypothetical protein